MAEPWTLQELIEWAEDKNLFWEYLQCDDGGPGPAPITTTVKESLKATQQLFFNLAEALRLIRDSGEGAFDATTGEGHARCREIAGNMLKLLELT